MSAKRPKSTPARRPSDITARLRVLTLGLGIGAAWGLVMCLALLAIGHLDGDDLFGWIYRIVTPALIGMVVATVMGPSRARRTASGGARR